MRDALKGLLGTVIEWNVVSDVTGEEDWTASSILASVSLKGPVCLYAYSPRMKQLLHSPAMFGKINLFIQSRFKSSYGLALYENCLRYRGLGFTKWFDTEVFRKLMGVPADKYTLFRDFKRRVLDKSVEEVNTYSDLFVEPEIRREGRRVYQLRFLLKERPRKVRLGVGETVEEATNKGNTLIASLAGQFGLSIQQANAVVQEYGDTVVREKMALVMASGGRVKNRAAYLMSALRNDYQAPAIVPVQVEKVPDDPGKEVGRQVERIRRAWQGYRDEYIEEALSMLEEDVLATLTSRFREQSAKAIQTVLRLQRRQYTAATVLNSPQIRVLFRQSVVEQMPALLAGMDSFEVFLAKQPEERQAAWAKLVEWNPDLVGEYV